MNKENSKIKYFLYARRSVEKRDSEEKVMSIDSQISEMKTLASSEGLKIVDIYSETKSAKEPYTRDKFQEMIKRIQKGDASGILCWKIDRLARNAIDEGTIKYLLQKGIIENIRASDRNWLPDDNALLSSVEFGVATQYSRDLAKHIQRGLRACVENGFRPCYAPIGYRNTKYHEKGKEQILVDEERFPLVRKLFDLMLTGKYNPFQLVKVAEDMGLRNRQGLKNEKVCKSNIYKMLVNTFYYGEFEYPNGSGNWYKGTHKAMITKDEYNKIQAILGREGKERPKTHFFALTGLMRCGECGARITAEEKFKHQKNGNVHHYVYYRCTKRIDSNCSQLPIREEVLNEQILTFLSSIDIPHAFHDWAFKALREEYETDNKNKVLTDKSKKQQIEQIEKRLASLLQMRMDGELNADEYKAKKNSLEEEKQNLELIEIEQEGWEKMMGESLSIAEDAYKKFKNGDIDVRRNIVSSLGYNHSLKDKILIIKAEKPFEVIGKVAKLIEAKK